MRLLTADAHPDHDTLCTFRRENGALLTESFVKVLQLAQQLQVLRLGPLTVAADGTKVLANASKHWRETARRETSYRKRCFQTGR